MLLGIYLPVFEGYHQCESYFAQKQTHKQTKNLQEEVKKTATN